jgi:hypothetical protein
MKFDEQYDASKQEGAEAGGDDVLEDAFLEQAKRAKEEQARRNKQEFGMNI